jgi:cytochrome b561
MFRNTLVRYGAVAMAFHWLIAAAILFNIWFGNYVHDMADDDPNHFAYVQIHKSIGLTVLALAFARLVWRLFDPPPPLPETMKPWERWAAKTSHLLLYGLMFAIPLTGWALVSSSPLGIPTFWFGLFEWPHLPFLADLPRAEKSVLRPQIFEAHEILATVMLYVFAVHALAGLKHHFIDRDSVLKRMLPGTRVEP